MKSIFRLILAIVAILSFCQSPVAAAETHYKGTLSGVECSACKKTIARSLAKIKGVKTIRIVKTGDDKHRLEVITDGTKALTRTDANKALSKSDHYKILSWSKTQG